MLEEIVVKCLVTDAGEMAACIEYVRHHLEEKFSLINKQK